MDTVSLGVLNNNVSRGVLVSNWSEKGLEDWVLFNGYWNDANIWLDSAVWQD